MDRDELENPNPGTSQSDFTPRVSLAIDAKNTPYILYGSKADAKLAVLGSSGWGIQNVASNVSSIGNLVLNSHGNPCFIYAINGQFGLGSKTIVYASWNGAAWRTQEVVPNASVGGVGTRDDFFTMGYLSLDSHDAPHIAYATNSSSYSWGTLAYVSWTGKAWDTQNVNSTIDAQSCYLAVDSNGNPHISLIGVVEGSQEAQSIGPYAFLAPVMYATVTQPIETATPVTVPPIPSALILPLALATLVVVAVVISLIYVYKKKRKATS